MTNTQDSSTIQFLQVPVTLSTSLLEAAYSGDAGAQRSVECAVHASLLTAGIRVVGGRHSYSVIMNTLH